MIQSKIRKLLEAANELRAKRLALILNEIVVNESSDIFEISKKIGLSESTIMNYLKNRELMLLLFNEEEYNEILRYINNITDMPGFYSKLENMSVKEKITTLSNNINNLSKYNSAQKKLILILNEIIVNKNNDISEISKKVGLSEAIIMNYLKNKNLILSLFSEEEYNEIFRYVNDVTDMPGFYSKLENMSVKEKITTLSNNINNLSKYNLAQKKLITILNELISADFKTLGILALKINFSLDLVLKYLNDEQLIATLFNKEECDEIKGIIDQALLGQVDLSEKFKYEAVNDVINSRYTLTEIAEKYNMSLKQLDNILHDQAYLAKNFNITPSDVARKIQRTAFICKSVPKSNDYMVIKDKDSIAIVKEDIYFLRSSHFHKLEIVTEYLKSSCNMEEVCKKLNKTPVVVLFAITDPAIKNILRDSFKEKYERIVNIEKALTEGELFDYVGIAMKMKKAIESSDDIGKALTAIDLPVGLIKRLFNKCNFNFTLNEGSHKSKI